MSRKTWGITVTVLAFLVVIAAAVWYTRRDQATPPEDQRGTELVEMLPAELQEEIRQGKYLRNEEELYNFLENYTS